MAVPIVGSRGLPVYIEPELTMAYVNFTQLEYTAFVNGMFQNAQYFGYIMLAIGFLIGFVSAWYYMKKKYERDWALDGDL